jgi:opacity protein-like surface antigen
MKLSKILSPMLALIFIPTLGFAEECCDIFEKLEEVNARPIIGATGGIAFSKIDASANYDVGFTTYDYDSHQETQTRGLWGGFLGLEYDWDDDWRLQSTVAYYQTSPFSSEGTFTQSADEISPDVYEYHFKVRSYQIMWENKILTEWRENYHPYFAVGLGVGINRAEDYGNNVNPFLAFTPEYKDNTETSFSYSFAVGIDYDMTDYLRLGLGYRFTDLGKASLEKAYLDTTELHHSIEKHHLYNQEIMLQLTYFFWEMN